MGTDTFVQRGDTGTPIGPETLHAILVELRGLRADIAALVNGIAAVGQGGLGAMLGAMFGGARRDG